MSEVSSLSSQVVDQITHLPTEATHPYLAAGVVAATGGLLAYELARADKAQDQFAAAFQDRQLLEKAVADVRSGDLEGHSRRQRRQRLAPMLGATLGFGLAISGVVGGFRYEGDKIISDARVAAVVDSSTSMRETRDLNGGSSRFDAVLAGLAESNYGGQLAVVESADKHRVRIPFTDDWQQKVGGLKKPEVDPNGGELVPAVEEAISLLPIEKNGAANTRAGTVAIISDGTISNTSIELQHLSKRVKDSGVNLRIVVPGRPKATYQLEGAKPTPSGAKPETFNDFEPERVKRATDKNHTKQAIKDILQAEGTSRQETRWWTLSGLGGVVMLLAGISGGRQRIKKIV